MEEVKMINNTCCLCKTSLDNEVLYGKCYKLKNIVVHYFCLLLATNIAQNGRDNEGILGFLFKDIVAEVQRGKRLRCIHCSKYGATITCSKGRCRASFHLPCGRENGSSHQFFGFFRSYCKQHRLRQSITPSVRDAVKGQERVCAICYESLASVNTNEILWAPCCRLNAWFHRDCVQKLALSAGYFFKCPLCNNKNQFHAVMKNFGIYIPDQDASWELEPDAYASLLERHSSCDADKCLCPKGRSYATKYSRWTIVLCSTCGSHGIHKACGNIESAGNWQCSLCQVVLKKNQLKGHSNRRAHGLSAAAAAAASAATVTSADDDDDDDDDHHDEHHDEPHDEHDVVLPNTSTNMRSRTSNLRALRRIRTTIRSLDSSEPSNNQQIPTNVFSSEVSNKITNPLEVVAPEDEDSSEIVIVDDSDSDIEVLPPPSIKYIKTNSGTSVPVISVSKPKGEVLLVHGDPSTNCEVPQDNDEDLIDIIEVKINSSGKSNLIQKPQSATPNMPILTPVKVTDERTVNNVVKETQMPSLRAEIPVTIIEKETLPSSSTGERRMLTQTQSTPHLRRRSLKSKFPLQNLDKQVRIKLHNSKEQFLKKFWD